MKNSKRPTDHCIPGEYTFLFKCEISNFPSSPVVKTLCFHCRLCGFNPWWGSYDLRGDNLIISYTESINHYNIKENIFRVNKLLIKENVFRSFPGIPMVKTPPSDAELRSFPSRGTKVPYALGCEQK